MPRNKKIWTQERLDTLYECWKSGKTTKESIPYIIDCLPDVPLPTAVSMMRKLARTDPKWVGWTTRKKNEQERVRIAKQQEKEKKQQEMAQRRNEREERKAKREKKQKDKAIRQRLDNNLEMDHAETIAEKIEPEFFFCSDVHQFVNNNACIFKVFSKGFPSDPACAKCKRMDKHIPVVEEVIRNAKPKKGSKNKASNGSKGEVKGCATT